MRTLTPQRVVTSWRGSRSELAVPDVLSQVQAQMASDQAAYEGVLNASDSLYEANETVAYNVGGWQVDHVEEID